MATGIKIEKMEVEEMSCGSDKQITLADIKKMLSSPNKNELTKQFAEKLAWKDLSKSIQEELLGKIRPICKSGIQLDDVVPLSGITSTALLQLIAESDGSRMLRLVIEDYFDQVTKSNGKVTWKDLDKSFQAELLSRLRQTSGVEQLKLEQVPLTSNILVGLICSQKRELDDHTLLGGIVSYYTSEARKGPTNIPSPSFCVNILCKVVMTRLVNFRFRNVYDEEAQSAINLLIDRGLLKEFECKCEAIRHFDPEGHFAFKHDTVYHYVTSLMIHRIGKQLKMSRMNCVNLFRDDKASPDPLADYFMDLVDSGKGCATGKLNFSPCSTVIDFNNKHIYDILMALAVLKMKNLQALSKLLTHFKEHGTSLPDVVYQIQLGKGGSIPVTLLHLAVNRGSLRLTKLLLHNFRFCNELGNPQFRNLTRMCVNFTYLNDDNEVQERIEILKEMSKWNKKLITANEPQLLCLHELIHVDLIKFVVEHGIDVFQKSVKGYTIVHNASFYMTPDQFHNLVNWLVKQGHSQLLCEKDTKFEASALLEAVSHMDVKLETISLFIDSGVSLHEINNLGSNIVFQAIIGMRDINYLSMLKHLGANYLHLDDEKNSALHIAVHCGHVDAIRYLAGLQGICPNLKNSFGSTPLNTSCMYAVKNCHCVVETLLELGADASLLDNNGIGPLTFALHGKYKSRIHARTKQLLSKVVNSGI